MVKKRIYIASTEGLSGKSVVTISLPHHVSKLQDCVTNGIGGVT